MIVVFVVDTSPSMGRPVSGDSSMSRIDLAKMAIEDLSRRLRKEQTSSLDATTARALANLGQRVYRRDSFLLLSTSRQHPDTASCAAGGRLLVGFGADSPVEENHHHFLDPLADQLHHSESFQRELKSLQAAEWDTSKPFPEEAGGAVGLNTALSMGLQLLSRYRLHHRLTENFGLGRLPNSAIMVGSSSSSSALQPACLVLVTDGDCLRQPPSSGGGSLQLQYGSQPLREFYREPFRWDQRIFCLAIGDAVDSSAFLHPQLRALCEVTGGSHWMIGKPSVLPTEALLKRIRPPLPRELPIPDPLYARIQSPTPPTPTLSMPVGYSFVNAGPVCCFQAYEAEDASRQATQRRAMLLYTASMATTTTQHAENTTQTVPSPPLWPIPEAFFPSKKLDTLPPRQAQPLLFYSKYPANLGSKSFEPMQVIKMLHRLDSLIAANRKLAGQPVRLLHRDVYICEWLSAEGGKPIQVSISSRTEYFPVFCPASGRPSLSDDVDNALNIGILHAPLNSSTLASQAGPSRLATLTLLPPEPHILLPLLLRAAEAEHRVLKKMADANQTMQKAPMVPLDEHWRSEFQAYRFRLPPYYQFSLKRSLRSVLPASVHALLLNDGMEPLAQQCFSNVCAQKIRNAEQVARDTNDRLERQEASLRVHNFSTPMDPSPRNEEKMPPLRYGQFDPRSSVDSYLAALRSMPPPWRVAGVAKQAEERKNSEVKSESASMISEKESESPKTALDVLGDLPAQCLMAYYESRRRWIFGGPSLATRGLHVEGVSNDGSNSHRCGKKYTDRQECLLSIAGVGVSVLNETSTTKMGDYRERLLFSRSPVVGYGSNDAAGVSATTAVDGSPVWSVDDSAMPLTFFDPKTGEFADSVQARVRSRLMVNFGNPYKERRADSLIPEKFYSQAPSMQQGGFGSILGSPRTPPGSPPHDSFDSVEEGEAMFVRTSPSRVSPKREEPIEDLPSQPPLKRPRTDSMDEKDPTLQDKPPPVPPKPPVPPPKPTATPPPPPKPATDTSSPKPPPPKASAAASGSPQPPKPAPPKKGQQPKPRPPPPKPAAGRPPAGQPPPVRRASSITAPKGPPPPVETKPKGPSPPPPASSPAGPPPKPSAKVQTPGPSPTNAAQLSTPAPASQPSAQTAVLTPAQPTLDLQSADKMPDVVLPPDWMCVWSKSQKRWYFFNKRSNKSVWKWPPDS